MSATRPWGAGTGRPPAVSVELRLCRVAAEAVGADRVGVVLVAGPDLRSPVPGSDTELVRLGDLQQSVQEGPLYELSRHGVPVVVDDLRIVFRRWPLLVAGLAASPLRSLAVLPVHLPGQTRLSGAVAAARDDVAPFSASELGVLTSLAEMLGGVLDLRAGGRAPLEDVLAPESETLSVAVGIVMARLHAGPDAALTELRTRAFVLGCTVHQLAARVVGGDWPVPADEAGDEADASGWGPADAGKGWR